MLTDPKLRSQVDALWNAFWTGGLTNPLDAIEQFTYLLFLKRLDDSEKQRQKRAAVRGRAYTPTLPDDVRWDTWARKPAKESLTHLKTKVFPQLRNVGDEGSHVRTLMRNAECKINKPNLLVQAVNIIESMQIGQQQQDVQGDLYEYLLSKLTTAGRNGQFRTPRHVIRLMVQMLDPQPGDRCADLAAGTAGFMVNVYQYILETHTSPETLTYDDDGWPHNLIGDRLTPEQIAFLETNALHGFDNDSGMTMLRIGAMNLMLHGIDNPNYRYADTLSEEYDEPNAYDKIFMNPPFKGAVDKKTLHPALQSAKTTKSELLFLHRILRVLDMGGQAAVIVPDGVLFGSSRAHVALRKLLVEENGLWGVVSMPSGVFKPYAGVSTAILIFVKGGTTDRIWFYDMAHDGFSLDDKRQPTNANDIPNLLDCWHNRYDAAFAAERTQRLTNLREQMEPLQTERLRLDGEINRLIFEATIAPNGSDAATEAVDVVKAEMDVLKTQMTPLKAAIDQLQRQFWVTKAQVKANKYDLSASRYRDIEQEPTFYEEPQVTMERLLLLEQVMADEINYLNQLV